MQIPLMGDVFTRASWTIAWLGTGGQTEEEGMRMLQSLYFAPTQPDSFTSVDHAEIMCHLTTSLISRGLEDYGLSRNAFSFPMSSWFVVVQRSLL